MGNAVRRFLLGGQTIEPSDALPGRYDEGQRLDFADAFRRDGFVVLPGQFDVSTLATWQRAFEPLLERHIAKEADTPNRGTQRYYVTLPFAEPFADPRIYADPDVVAICRIVVGADMTMCQLATDTPLLGSQTQDVHRDALPLFPELASETPPYQLAVNVPLVDVSRANGPTEIARGTQNAPKDAGLARIQQGTVALEAVEMRVGDVMLRDVRALHRGTPNTTNQPRPMVVIGYSRAWLFRPEVSVHVPRSMWERLGSQERFLLRFNPIVEGDSDPIQSEGYRTFAF